MTGWIIALSVAAVAFLLLISSFKITIRLDTDAYFEVKFLFFTLFRYSPEKNKPQRTKSKTTSNKDEGTSKLRDLLKKYSEGKSRSKIISELLELIKAFLISFKRFIRRIVFKDLVFDLTVGSDDAAKTALLYGSMCTLVYSISALLSSAVNFNPKKISVNSDFTAEQMTLGLKCTIKVKLCFVIAFAISLIFKVIKIKIGEIKNGRT